MCGITELVNYLKNCSTPVCCMPCCTSCCGLSTLDKQIALAREMFSETHFPSYWDIQIKLTQKHTFKVLDTVLSQCPDDDERLRLIKAFSEPPKIAERLDNCGESHDFRYLVPGSPFGDRTFDNSKNKANREMRDYLQEKLQAMEKHAGAQAEFKARAARYEANEALAAKAKIEEREKLKKDKETRQVEQRARAEAEAKRGEDEERMSREKAAAHAQYLREHPEIAEEENKRQAAQATADAEQAARDESANANARRILQESLDSQARLQRQLDAERQQRDNRHYNETLVYFNASTQTYFKDPNRYG